jgi:methylenetetrahydrofolate dehydrogenase (NADP+)/methenyltetrahydrofolate cyclohydrolase
VTSILLQLPISKSLDAKKLIDYIDPSKDVDGLTTTNIGKLCNNQKGIIPCTALGIVKLLEHCYILLEGKNVVILGRSNLVGKPLISLLLNKNATVTVCHSKTTDLSSYTRQADILISAVGKKHFITKDMIKEGSILIDVGINIVDDALYGDIDFEDVYDQCQFISPVPGGIGPMTTIMLIYNIIECYKCQLTDNRQE